MDADGHSLRLLVHHQPLPVRMGLAQQGDQAQADKASTTRKKHLHDEKGQRAKRVMWWLAPITVTVTNQASKVN